MYVPLPLRIIRKTETSSTMEDAVTAIREGYGHGTVCLSEHQSAGRGRLSGRRWENTVSSLLFTLVLDKRSFNTSYPPSQTMALALSRYIEKTDSIHPQIKWPNDILLDGKKIAGILVETEGPFFLLGMGLNLVLGKTIGDFRSPIAGLSEFTQRKMEAESELYGICAQLENLICKPAPVQEIECRLAYVGKTVTVHLGDPGQKHTEHGYIVGLNNDGALLIDTGSNIFLPVYSGEIEFS